MSKERESIKKFRDKLNPVASQNMEKQTKEAEEKKNKATGKEKPEADKKFQEATKKIKEYKFLEDTEKDDPIESCLCITGPYKWKPKVETRKLITAELEKEEGRLINIMKEEINKGMKMIVKYEDVRKDKCKKQVQQVHKGWEIIKKYERGRVPLTDFEEMEQYYHDLNSPCCTCFCIEVLWVEWKREGKYHEKQKKGGSSADFAAKLCCIYGGYHKPADLGCGLCECLKPTKPTQA